VVLAVTSIPRPLDADNHARPAADQKSGASSKSAQVFLSYGEADTARSLRAEGNPHFSDVSLVQAVAELLAEAGFTVLDCQQVTDGRNSEDVVVSRAIEACDNLVVLLSPQSLRQSLCLQGLLFALSMNKRIVPLLLDAINPSRLPTPLQTLPMIDLRQVSAPLSDTQAGQQLVATLTQDADYYQAHKQLLIQSLQWERQHRNPCLLLRGDCLQQYLRWWSTARHHPQHPPIRLQTLFLETCRMTQLAESWQVHLIHSAVDADYAFQFSNLLQLFGQSTSFNHLELMLEGNSRQQYRRAIEQAHYCGLILSPEAMQREEVLADLDYALSLHKPLIIVEGASTQTVELPSRLQHCPRFHWPDLDCTAAVEFGQLFRCLEQNQKAAAYHTRLLQLALQWQQQDRNPKLLLQHRLLLEAVAWVESQPTPMPTELQRAYIQSSQHRRPW
jgi:hypothetical protein